MVKRAIALGQVSRQMHMEVPPRVEHALTESGASLLQPVGDLTAWAERGVRDGAG